MADIIERLMEVAKAGFEVELKALLRDPGCDALAKRENGMTALMWASIYGHEACVQLLLPKSDALSASKSGLTALMHAASVGHEACVELLLPSSDASAQAADGMTALIYAARMGHKACIKLLLPVSDVLAKNKSGATASDDAKYWGREKTAQSIDAYVLAQTEKADIDAATSPGAPRGRPALRV